MPCSSQTQALVSEICGCLSAHARMLRRQQLHGRSSRVSTANTLVSAAGLLFDHHRHLTGFRGDGLPATASPDHNPVPAFVGDASLCAALQRRLDPVVAADETGWVFCHDGGPGVFCGRQPTRRVAAAVCATRYCGQVLGGDGAISSCGGHPWPTCIAGVVPCRGSSPGCWYCGAAARPRIRIRGVRVHRARGRGRERPHGTMLRVGSLELPTPPLQCDTHRTTRAVTCGVLASSKHQGELYLARSAALSCALVTMSVPPLADVRRLLNETAPGRKALVEAVAEVMEATKQKKWQSYSRLWRLRQRKRQNTPRLWRLRQRKWLNSPRMRLRVNAPRYGGCGRAHRVFGGCGRTHRVVEGAVKEEGDHNIVNVRQSHASKATSLQLFAAGGDA